MKDHWSLNPPSLHISHWKLNKFLIIICMKNNCSYYRRSRKHLFRFILDSFRNTSLECNLEPLSHVNLWTTRGFIFKSYHVNCNEKSTNMITLNRVISFLTLFFILNTPLFCNIGKCFNARNTSWCIDCFRCTRWHANVFLIAAFSSLDQLFHVFFLTGKENTILLFTK